MNPDARPFDKPLPTGPVARLLDPDTSKAAGHAKAADPTRLSEAQRWVLTNLAAAYHRGDPGLTDFQHGHMQQTSAGKRRKELERAHLVADSGTRAPSPTGSTAIVWTITDAGLYAARGLPLGSVA